MTSGSAGSTRSPPKRSQINFACGNVYLGLNASAVHAEPEGWIPTSLSNNSPGLQKAKKLVAGFDDLSGCWHAQARLGQ